MTVVTVVMSQLQMGLILTLEMQDNTMNQELVLLFCE